MEDWNSKQYLKFEAERTQPARDLAAGVLPLEPHRVLDLGCGPGNSTQVLLSAFPGAEVVGADKSDTMLAQAAQDLPGVPLIKCDLQGDLSPLGGEYDLVFSNACLQWIPGHQQLFPRLMTLLRPGGMLAVQVPMQDREHVHSLIGQLIKQPPFDAYIPKEPVFHTLPDLGYIDLLCAMGAEFRVWKTVYYHLFPSCDLVLEWYRGAGLRPYLAALPPELHAPFEEALLREVRLLYPPQKDGQVAYPFPRFFMVATKVN